MPGKNDIDPLSITDGKISNLANINPKKLAKATEGQILVAQSDGRFAAKSLTGDITLEASGAASVTSTTTTTDGETTVVTGPAGPTGAQGQVGAQGAQGPAGSDATVTTSAVDSAGAVMETDLVQTSAGAGDASKPIKLDSTGKIDASMIDDGDISYNNIADVPSTFAPSAHTHDDRYYTETETDTLLAAKAASSHNHDTAYLGITAKAADSDKLDGNDSSAFAVASHTHTLSNITDAGTAAASATTDFAAASHNHDHNALTNYDVAEHRVIDDSSTDSQEKLWSAYNIVTHLAAKAPYNTATSTTDGLMDNTDKVFLDKLAAQISIPSSGTFAGFIGINDSSPQYRLDVDGTARFTSAVTFGGYTFPVFDGDVGKALVTDGAGTLSFSNIAVANVTGLGDSATKDVGTGSTDVAAGDHTHPTGNNGFVPAAGTSGQFLAHDGTFATPPNTQLSNENVQDIVGAMFSGNTETNITATYFDNGNGDGKINLSVENYPSKYTAQITFGQGAQGTDVDFTLTNGSGTVTHNGYILNHNLGTQALVASVRTPYDPTGDNSDDQTPDSWNDLFDYLYWQHMDVGYAAGNSIDVNAVLVATVNSSRLADDNYCAIAIPVDADDNPSRLFEVTLIG